MTGALSGETLSVRIEALRAEMDPEDQRAHLAMGVLLRWRAGEVVSQMAWRHGLHGDLAGLLDDQLWADPRSVWEEEAEEPPDPVIPPAEEPAPFDYDALRAVAEDVYELTLAADQAFSKVDDSSVKLVVDYDRVVHDVNGDGRLSPEEIESRRTSEEPPDWLRDDLERRGAPAEYIAWRLDPPRRFALDTADASFERAGGQMLLAITAAFLAVDLRDFVDRTVHLVAPKSVSRYGDVLHPLERNPDSFLQKQRWQIRDVLAAVHTADLGVVDEQMRRAVLEHALQSLAMRRQGIQRALVETDDDREKFPGPQQSGYAEGVRVDDEYLEALRAKLDHQENLLMGRALIPFWRGGREQRMLDGRGLGLNLRRAILEPESYDPILWLHGSAATPYLEEGRFLPMEVREQIREGLSAQRQWTPPEPEPPDHAPDIGRR